MGVLFKGVDGWEGVGVVVEWSGGGWDGWVSRRQVFPAIRAQTVVLRSQ